MCQPYLHKIEKEKKKKDCKAFNKTVYGGQKMITDASAS